MGSKRESTKKNHLKKLTQEKTQAWDKNNLKLRVLTPEMLLIAIFILALVIRLVYLNQIISTPIFYGLAMDSDKYENYALEITKGNFTHKDSIYLNPLYPFFLALIYSYVDIATSPL